MEPGEGKNRAVICTLVHPYLVPFLRDIRGNYCWHPLMHDIITVMWTEPKLINNYDATQLKVVRIHNALQQTHGGSRGKSASI